MWSPIKVYNLKGTFTKRIPDVHRMSWGKQQVQHYMLYLRSSYSLWQVGLKFNEFPWERFANKVQLFQKITIWQKIPLCYSSWEERQRTHCFAGRFPPDISVGFSLYANSLWIREESHREEWVTEGSGEERKERMSVLASWPLSIRSLLSSNSSDYKLSWYLKWPYPTPPLLLASTPPHSLQTRVSCVCMCDNVYDLNIREHAIWTFVCVCVCVCVGVCVCAGV